MSLSLESIESKLKAQFRSQVVDQGIEDSVRFLTRWAYLSSQVPRLHGAALARVSIPDIQCLLAEIACGECGFGDRATIHSKLMNYLLSQFPMPQNLSCHLGDR